MPFRRLLFTMGLVLITGMSFVFPVNTFAAEDTCECYCNIEGKGATKYGSTRVTAGRCQELCREDGFSVAACAVTPAQKPQYNIMCFMPDECKDQEGTETATGSGTQIQPGECKQGMKYCYPDPSKRIEARLQVPIGNLTVTGDFGEYISVVYKWMLGVGTTIAIVFMMVAGLRWTLGGANAEQIGEAKKTITNALVGLILLLSTYFIIYTVNPYLVRLQVPAFPMIKLVSLVGKDSCGYLAGVWGPAPYLIKNGAPLDSPYAEGQVPGLPYTLANLTKGTSCGSVADVVDAPEGEKLEDDMTCTFDYCPTSDEKCFKTVEGGKCVTCAQVAATLLADSPTGINPSESNCAQLAPPHEYTSEHGDIQVANYCNYVSYPGASDSCSSLSVDCLAISSCDKYSAMNISGLLTQTMADLVGTVYGMTIERLCEEDVCRAGARSQTTCVFYELRGCQAASSEE